MSDVQQRAREQGPEQEGIYDQNFRERRERNDRMRRGRYVIKADDVPWDLSRQGRLRYYTFPESYPGAGISEMPALTDFKVFLHEIHTQSGAHRHQGGLVIYIIEGEGYSLVDGVQVDWKAGDLLLLPVRPGGVVHQHFNVGEITARWLAFRFEPFHEAMGDEVTQVSESPQYLRSIGKE